MPGWSTGPTSALTFYLLGLQIKSPKGATWSVAPVLSGLNAAEGGFETSLGWFGVQWNASSSVVTAAVSTPDGTNGTVTLPGSGEIQLDGQAQNGSDTGVVQVSGGNHTLVRQLS